MRRRHPVDLVLTDAAETILRNRSRRPGWLPAGYPMRLILTQKRPQLLAFLANEPGLRDLLRHRWRSQLNVGHDELTAEALRATLDSAHDPDRLVAAALIAPDHEVARAATWWAEDLGRIPQPSFGAEAIAANPAPASVEIATDVISAATADTPSEPPEVALISAAELTGADEEPAVQPEDHPDTQFEHAARLVAEEKLEKVTRELDAARAAIRRLEAANLELQSKVPTKGDVRRANKERGELQRAARELLALTEQTDALREERDSLLSRLRVTEDNLDEAIAARSNAERARRSLEDRLASIEGRAGYLRRSLDSEIETVALAHSKATGKESSRLSRRLTNLGHLRDLLDELFPTSKPVASEPVQPTRRVAIRDLDVRLVPLGGAEEIGGSALLVCAGDRRILIDAGMRPDGGGPRDLSKLETEKKIDAIILTHAHNDHVGYVPALIQRFSAPVLASIETAALLHTMWKDSADVMRRAYEEAGDGQSARLPLYGEGEVEQAVARIEEVPYNRARRIADIEYTLFPAGHVLGAAGVVLNIGGRRIVVTGDITSPSDEHLAVQPAALPARLVREADLLVIESTYCQGDHVKRQHEVGSLVDVVRSVTERRGRVLIPAFGLGRAQEIAMILANELPEVEVLVDGLAKAVSEIYENVSARQSRAMKVFKGRVRPVENRSREMKSFRAGVIVAPSGMLNGGAAVSWAHSILPEENDALLLCGYQDAEAPGKRLYDLVHSGRGPKMLELPDREEGSIAVPVKARVEKYRLSAHADRRGLLDIVGEVHPGGVMLVHGEKRHQQTFRQVLSQAGHPFVPTREWRL